MLLPHLHLGWLLWWQVSAHYPTPVNYQKIHSRPFHMKVKFFVLYRMWILDPGKLSTETPNGCVLGIILQRIYGYCRKSAYWSLENKHRSNHTWKHAVIWPVLKPQTPDANRDNSQCSETCCMLPFFFSFGNVIFIYLWPEPARLLCLLSLAHVRNTHGKYQI